MKIKKYHLFLFVSVLSLSSFLNIGPVERPVKENPQVKHKPITFIENSFASALKKAKAAHKYIFVDAYASWCAPCKLLKKTTFNDSQAAGFFNTGFVNVSIDMEKGNGPELASKWDIQEYPTLLVVDINGEVVLRSVGYLDAKQLIDFGQQALASITRLDNSKCDQTQRRKK